jgi:hypothetical protein
LSLPEVQTRSPLDTELAVLMASWRKQVTVNQLVSPSIQEFLDLSKRRLEEAKRNEVIGKPSWVTKCLGVVATKP